MAKLGKIAEQAEKFLRLFATDLGIDVKAGEWLAADFKNSSVEFQAELPREVPTATLQFFANGLEVLADYDPENEGLNGRVGEAAALEYSRIGSLLDPDEIIRMGIVPSDSRAPRWRDITYSAFSSMRQELEQPITSHGSIQGIVHAWYKEAKEPHFQIRELATDELVRVFYGDGLYNQVAQAVQERSTVLIVDGLIKYDKVSRKAIDLRAERIEPMLMMSTTDFEEVFGSAPTFEPTFIEEADWLN